MGRAAPPAPTRGPRLIPADPDQFALDVFVRLNKGPYTLPPSWKEDAIERERHNAVSSLAEACVYYLEVQEAAGQPPTINEFGRQKFGYYSRVLADDINVAWEIYQYAIQETVDVAQAAPS